MTPYRFFYRNAGYSYDPKTETKAQGRSKCAKALAEAEAWAKDNAIEYRWEQDDIDSTTFRHDVPAYPLWVCLMYKVLPDGSLELAESLSGVDFGEKEPWGQDYKRVVEAELALECEKD